MSSTGPWKRSFRAEPRPSCRAFFQGPSDLNSDQILWAQLCPPPPHKPATYQVQLVTLNPLGPATSLLFTLLYTLELVPVPAHRGLPSKRTWWSVLSEQPLGAGGGAAPTLITQEALKSISLQKTCSLTLSTMCSYHSVQISFTIYKNLPKFHLKGSLGEKRPLGWGSQS